MFVFSTLPSTKIPTYLHLETGSFSYSKSINLVWFQSKYSYLHNRDVKVLYKKSLASLKNEEHVITNSMHFKFVM